MSGASSDNWICKCGCRKADHRRDLTCESCGHCHIFRRKQINFAAMLNVKNEERWIGRVLASLLPLCDEIFVLDDHSEDATARICQTFPQVRYYPSPFEGLDKSRDKQYLLDRVLSHGPAWVVAIDGDEILDADAPEMIRGLAATTEANAFSLRVLYVWDAEEQVRVDGVYNTFWRPSVFRPANPDFGFESTPFPGNLHCPNVPQELLHGHAYCEAKIWHYGYFDKALRLRKYNWRQVVDPNAEAEDHYRHMVQGDVPEVPADAVLKHAGPLAFKRREELP